MKKIFIVLFGVLLLSGCSSKKESIDLDNIQKELLNSKYFENHEVVSKDVLEKRYSLDLDKAQNVLMISSKSYDDATMVLIADKKVKNEIDSFVSAYNDQWVKMNYFPEQKELVEKAVYKISGDYVIYLVSENNDEVLKLIKLN